MKLTKAFLKLNFITLFLFFSSACSVAPWERGNLAKRDMLVTPNPIYTSFRAHVFDSKEASAGGSGAVGGGCGCN